MADSHPGTDRFPWPGWVPVLFATVTTVAVLLTIADEGISGSNLALAALILGLTWAGCVIVAPGAPATAKAAVLVVACAALASDPGSEVLLVACIACAEAAIDASTAASAAVLGLALASVIARALAVGGQFSPIEYFPWPIAMAASWLGGMFVRSQMRLNAELRAKQNAVASEAAGHERRRLAREIHDVIAHSLTVTTLHVSAARLNLQDEPPDVGAALEALAEAERQGRQSLADIRTTVGLLTTDAPDESQLAAPLPGATDLHELVRSFAEAGQPVTWSVEGDLERVPPTTGLAMYRVVQESLANAAKHAPGAAVDVDVRVCQGLFGLGPMFGLIGRPVGRVDVQVTNGPAACEPSPPQPGGGLGIVGMKERVVALGGRVDVGPEGNGWRVFAHLPVPTT